MLQQPSLAVPSNGTGRSRFSKALPAVPGLDLNAIPPMHPPPNTSLPQLPSQRRDSLRTFESNNESPVWSLSSLPTTPAPSTTPNTPLSADAAANRPPRMAIPRKPIGKLMQQRPGASDRSVPTPNNSSISAWSAPGASIETLPPVKMASLPPTPMSRPLQVSKPSETGAGDSFARMNKLPQPLPSPSESLSSILSAYSRSTNGDALEDESDGMARKSYATNTESTRDSREYTNTYASPSPVAATLHQPSSKPTPPPTSTITKYSIYPPQISGGSITRKPVLDRSLPSIPTPPPAKLNKDLPTPGRTISPAATTALAIQSDLANLPSSKEPQLWRRRSQSGSRGLPPLQIDTSNGSTAESWFQPQPNSATKPEGKKLPQPPALGFRILNGLPGRNVKPLPQPGSSSDFQTAQQTPPQNMGNETSKLRQLRQKLSPSKHFRKDSSSGRSERTLRPATNRPPTPEYQKEDVKSPIIDTFVTTVSPASSPEPPITIVSSEPARQQLPNARNSRTDVSQVAQHSNTVSRADPRPARPLPDLKVQTSLPNNYNNINNPLPPIGGYRSERRDSITSETNLSVYRARESTGSSKFPPREPSTRPDGRSSVNQSRYSGTDSDPRIVRSDSRGTMYKGRDGTLYPEMKNLREPDPRAFNFPTVPTTASAGEDVVVRASRIKVSHHRCFHQHKIMKRMINKNYPLSCQTCDKEDVEDRWSCTFCHLRICDGCMQKFDANSRDLGRFIEQLNQFAPLSLSSGSRSASALGFNPFA